MKTALELITLYANDLDDDDRARIMSIATGRDDATHVEILRAIYADTIKRNRLKSLGIYDQLALVSGEE